MKMILDLDTGIDDALAIAYALGRPEIDLIGITTAFGNVTIDKAVKNSLSILELLGRSDVPVFEGAAHPSTATSFMTTDHLHRIHGLNGIGNVVLDEPKGQKSTITAVDFLIDAAVTHNEELVLVATGPMTNLAEAIKKDRAAIEKIGKIVVMGSALTVPGNISQFAEANIYNDPDAAKYVLESGIPLVLVGLDVTLKTMIEGSDIASWTEVDTAASRAITEMATYYYTNEYEEEEIVGGALHDPLAVEVAINPAIITASLPINLTVETKGPSIGRTTANMRLLNQKEKSAQVCVDVEGDLFIKKFTQTVHEILK
ncbi:nucleoside hydrolase [Candidatus Enterococcus mansonii]|uniref:Inosine/uridine-preferring nucleoside hydrolase domain-containing protein n=1 Tax=Candidatus Enterococcus mansonii TaxID=1834181 RepID=A0A242CC46_9ENTE|nr:nucleoside hydrolase [Enterococcus sp. 4G2_DIV0659]OTO07766.1 hypothetical protein A5880_002036 [Enterococcus sp. 4G2_DIV0659]